MIDARAVTLKEKKLLALQVCPEILNVHEGNDAPFLPFLGAHHHFLHYKHSFSGHRPTIIEKVKKEMVGLSKRQ